MPKLAVIFLSRSSGSEAIQPRSLLAKLARLFHGGFRHQDHEFVAAVTRDNIGTAAILLENVAHALQYHVAFEVAVEIVHELEAVEVHQDEREGTVCARGTLPFLRKRFHQEAVRLDAREPVGDGLFLCFLERQRIVQRAGKKIGESAQEQEPLHPGSSHFSDDSTYKTPSRLSAYDTGKAIAETLPGTIRRGVVALTSRTMASCPVRATWPTRPSPSRMRRPTRVVPRARFGLNRQAPSRSNRERRCRCDRR